MYIVFLGQYWFEPSQTRVELNMMKNSIYNKTLFCTYDRIVRQVRKCITKTQFSEVNKL